MVTNAVRSSNAALTRALTAGAVAGLGGGTVFGMLMAMMGMLPMVGMLVGQNNAVIGFGVHMSISAFIGAVYGIVGSRLTLTWGTAVIAGVVNGIVWWILGALILMPLLLGMAPMILVIEMPQVFSLMGHLMYGIVTALLFIPLSERF